MPKKGETSDAPAKQEPAAEKPQVQSPKAEEPKAEAPVKKKEPAIQPKAKEETAETGQSAADAEDEKIKTQYQKLSGTTFTGQTIDLSQFNKPKKKKEEFKKDAPKQQGAGNGNHQNQ